MDEQPAKTPDPKKDKLVAWLLTTVFIVVGFGATLMNWQTFFDEGKYYPKMAFFAPLIGFIGLAMLLGPSNKPEDVAGDDAAARRRILRQRLAQAVVVIGLVAAGVNFALMNGWIGDLAE